VVAAVHAAVAFFRGEAAPADDATVIAVRIFPAGLPGPAPLSTQIFSQTTRNLDTAGSSR
jgi:hypothetical protein